MSKVNNKNNIYKIKGMNCPSCAAMIELDLEDAGIKAKCSFARQTLEVENNSDNKNIKKIVSNLGYEIEE